MGLRSKSLTITAAAAGLAALSQAPEYAQQYRQRIGGAIDELRTVVADFDNDAAASGLSRDRALDQMLRSSERFPRDRGESMIRTVTRFETLSAQKLAMDNAHPITRPLFVLRNPDAQVMQGAWEDFTPAVPLTSSGAVYGGIGALIAVILARLGIGTTRVAGRRRADRRLAKSAAQGAAMAEAGAYAEAGAGEQAVATPVEMAAQGHAPMDGYASSEESVGTGQRPGLLDAAAEGNGSAREQDERFGYRPRDRV